MNNFAAIIPIANMDSINAGLLALGWGPDNFSVPAYAGPSATHAMLHSWWDQAFFDDVSAVPGVVIAVDQTPAELVTQVTTQTNTVWSNNAQPLTGIVTPGLYYTMDGQEQVFWWVIQQYDTAIWPDPLLVPALIMMARTPGVATVWVQPLGSFDAYPLIDTFTGLPIQVTHAGQVWNSTIANNVWEPGVFGWAVAP